ncbi:MAG TPA: tetratricopeptide repeat protein, partial [Blastocatellia bacterium]|nr:tetratricopeptide repeat protein [Blastocatellia bacterium]
ANEPQRPDLRRALASTLARQRRYDEAIAILRDGWALAGRDPEWLIEVAQIQVRQGRRDDAVQTIRQALAAKKNIRVYERTQMAARLAAWGLNAEAVRLYEQAFAELAKNLKEESASSEDVAKYARTLIKVEPAPAIFQKLERLRAQFNAIAENSKDVDAYRARNIITGVDQAMRTDFGRGVVDYATATEANAVASAIRAAVANLKLYSDREQLLRYLGIARGANLVEVEELIYTQIKDAAFNARRRPEDTEYYNELRALVSFYNRHGAYSRAAEVLAAEYARDPHKGRFDYQTQIANQYRLAGDRARELDALRAAYSGTGGALTDGRLDWVERYLTLLYDSGARDELGRLASSYSPYQLQLVNFFIEKNEKALARQAIANANQSPAWVASRSGEVGLFLKDTAPETESFFRSALDIRSIGDMLGRRPDPASVLVGDDWFTAARNYGYWLGLQPAREPDSRNFVPAEVEGHPAQARAQLELAAYYLDRKDAVRADQHTGLAAELAPADKSIAVLRGSIALARGNRKEATDAWAQIISGKVTVEDAQLYLDVMADNGMLREALPQLENFIAAYVNRRAQGEERAAAIEAVKPLLREAANRAAADKNLQAAVAAFFQGTLNRLPGDILLSTFLIEEDLLPEAGRAAVYRLHHQRLSDKAAAVFGTSEYEDGYYDVDGYFYPAQALAEWRKRFLDYLIKARAFDEARLLIATIRQEQADLALALRESDETSYRQDRYEWLPLASALLELRAGRDAANAIAELRRYCGLEAEAGQSQNTDDVTSGLHERCLKAYALLAAEGKATEAEDLLYEAYRADVRSRAATDAAIAGLAEIEARRGQADEAGRLLRYLVERSTNNHAALALAAETAARAGRYADAVEFREQIARANPDDAENKLELARALAAAGRAADAMERIAALTAERTTPNRVRAQAAEVAGEIARGGAVSVNVFDQRAAQGDAGALLARAAIAEATGRDDEAAGHLSRVNAGPLAAIARMKLGLLALKAGRDAEAVTHFERALYLDADGAMTDAIAFRMPGPRVQLISLYSRVQRDLAAIRLAEGDGDRRPLISADLLSGSGSEDSAASATVAFEPSLDSVQSKAAGLRTIAELNTSASAQAGSTVLAALAQSAARLGQYDRAIAIERLRASEATQPEEKAAIEKRLAEIVAAQRAREQRLATLLRVDRANAAPSVYAARVLGN